MSIWTTQKGSEIGYVQTNSYVRYRKYIYTRNSLITGNSVIKIFLLTISAFPLCTDKFAFDVLLTTEMTEF